MKAIIKACPSSPGICKKAPKKSAVTTGRVGVFLDIQRSRGNRHAQKIAGKIRAEKEAGAVVEKTLNSTGRPLDNGIRGHMEAGYGRDFSDVRVHTDDMSAESAALINADAYTSGRDIVFGKGMYAPGTPRGDALIAHELAHVIQQGGSRQRVSRWTKAGVEKFLCEHGEHSLVKKLNGIKVYSYDVIKRRYRCYVNGKFEVREMESAGESSIGDNSIYIKNNDSISDAEAASVIYHEVTHLGQDKKMSPIEMEYDAWIKQEEFNIRHGIPPKHPSFRKKKGDKHIVDEQAVKKIVDELYADLEKKSGTGNESNTVCYGGFTAGKDSSKMIEEKWSCGRRKK